MSYPSVDYSIDAIFPGAMLSDLELSGFHLTFIRVVKPMLESNRDKIDSGFYAVLMQRVESLAENPHVLVLYYPDLSSGYYDRDSKIYLMDVNVDMGVKKGKKVLIIIPGIMDLGHVLQFGRDRQMLRSLQSLKET